MTVAGTLLDVALGAARAPESPDLRPAVLTDLAAAAGRVGGLVPRLRAVVPDGGTAGRAFRLAARMHARTQDDFYPAGKVHVGTTVLPAALAVSEGDVRPALAAGVAVIKAVSHVYRADAQSRGFRPTGLFAPLGAAVAAGVAMGLAPDQLASALALAAATAGGTNQAWVSGTDEWLVEVAVATRAGVEAALLAAAGAVGAPEAIEGPAGWANAFFGDEGARRLAVFLEGPAPLPLGPLAVKPFPVSGIAQVPSAAAAGLGRELGGARPRAMVVRLAPTDVSYPGTTNRGPFRSRADSLMSIARCVALAYLDGAITVDRLDAAPRPDEQAVLDVVELVPDREIPEEAVEIIVEVDGATRSRALGSRQVLYPSVHDLSADLPGLAERSEAPLDVVVALAGIVGTGSIVPGPVLAALGEGVA